MTVAAQSAKTSAKAAAIPRLSRAKRTALLKALADPKRFELLENIAKASCPMACTQAQTALAIAPATLSHHVKELESAGLIKIERVGKYHFLHLQPDVLEAVAALLQSLARMDCPQG
jgi:ArsR family transcriptional regulator, arsenate/arsenite/antimonite-responsive transcriptional repressor